MVKHLLQKIFFSHYITAKKNNKHFHIVNAMLPLILIGALFWAGIAFFLEWALNSDFYFSMYEGELTGLIALALTAAMTIPTFYFSCLKSKEYLSFPEKYPKIMRSKYHRISISLLTALFCIVIFLSFGWLRFEKLIA